MGGIENWNAQYWASSTGDSNMKDATFAAEVMHKDGCTLVTEGWVKNHWGWIMWKLANTVCVWPEREGGWWTFEEVLKELKYQYVYLSVMLGCGLKQCGRYECDINQCQHPAIRLIQERDASPASAMVLCVFEINWPAEGDLEGSTACPEFILMDWWYKICVRMDQALARAARKGKIQVGRKLGIIGAWVGCPQSVLLDVDLHVLSQFDTVSKAPDEVLKSFDVSYLVITSNGTHLAPRILSSVSSNYLSLPP